MKKWLLTVSVLQKSGGTKELTFVFEAASVHGSFDVEDELAANAFLREIGVNMLRIEKVEAA